MNHTSVPNIIIDEHLTQAAPEFLSVCLLYLRHAENGGMTADRAAKVLSVGVDAVSAALEYWSTVGINLTKDNPVLGASKIKPVSMPVHSNKMPDYSTDDIESMAQNAEDVRYLFQMAEQLLGKALKYHEMSLLLGFYDYLALTVPVIEVLLDYCVSNGKTNMRYIEAVALDWADNDITTVEDAESYIKTFNVDYREILKALGLGKRDPSPVESAYMRRWLREWHLPLDLVILACEKTIMQTGGTRFTYIESILDNWHKKNITTTDQAEEDEKEYRASQIEKTEKRYTANTKKRTPRQKSRFANYKGHDYDFTELERLALEYTDRAAAEEV